jgi:hypothetical protein
LRRQLRQEPQLYLSSETYSSNIAHCPRESSQYFLLATKGTTACWEIRQSTNKIKHFPPYLMVGFLSSPNYSGLAAVTYESFTDTFVNAAQNRPLVNVKLPDYYFYRLLA